jgi:hypothetical protein
MTLIHGFQAGWCDPGSSFRIACPDRHELEAAREKSPRGEAHGVAGLAIPRSSPVPAPITREPRPKSSVTSIFGRKLAEVGVRPSCAPRPRC